MKIEITKQRLLREVNNSMCHNFYWLFNVRFTCPVTNRVARAKFVLWDDIESICEYFTDEDAEEYVSVSKAQIKGYGKERAWSTVLSYFGWQDEDKALADYPQKLWDEFVEFCNKSIEDYNN